MGIVVWVRFPDPPEGSWEEGDPVQEAWGPFGSFEAAIQFAERFEDRNPGVTAEVRAMNPPSSVN